MYYSTVFFLSVRPRTCTGVVATQLLAARFFPFARLAFFFFFCLPVPTLVLIRQRNHTFIHTFAPRRLHSNSAGHSDGNGDGDGDAHGCWKWLLFCVAWGWQTETVGRAQSAQHSEAQRSDCTSPVCTAQCAVHRSAHGVAHGGNTAGCAGGRRSGRAVGRQRVTVRTAPRGPQRLPATETATCH